MSEKDSQIKVDISTIPLEEVTKSSLMERINFIKQFPLNVANMPQFQDTIRADMDSISSYIMLKESNITDTQRELESIVNMPKIKNENWENNIWYKFFTTQREILKGTNEVSITKFYHTQYLIETLNKMSMLIMEFRKEFIGLQKLEAEKDLLTRMMDMANSREKTWMDQYSKEINNRMDGINKVLLELSTSVNEAKLQTKMSMDQMKGVREKIESDLSEFRTYKDTLKDELVVLENMKVRLDTFADRLEKLEEK